MFHFENVTRSLVPTTASFSNPPTHDGELLEKEADEMGAAAAVAEVLEVDPPDDESEMETLLTVPAKAAKAAVKPSRQGKRAEDADRSTDPIALYAKDVRKYDLLTFEDEVRLSTEYRAGNAKS